MKIKDLVSKNKGLKTYYWIIITAIVTWFVEKSCNRIIPDNPVIVKEVSDTIKLIHSYDWGVLNDSVVHAQLQNRLDNIELMEKYENKVINKIKEEKVFNSIKMDASFPKAKGYSPQNAAAYFSLNISSLQSDFIEFELSFINRKVLKYIYCLSLKIFKIENDKEYYILNENYDVNSEKNLIRIVNTLPKGTYKFCVGFIFEKDKNDVYPNVYQLSKTLNK